LNGNEFLLRNEREIKEAKVEIHGTIEEFEMGERWEGKLKNTKMVSWKL
jgi:hypothetical protein